MDKDEKLTMEPPYSAIDWMTLAKKLEAEKMKASSVLDSLAMIPSDDGKYVYAPGATVSSGTTLDREALSMEKMKEIIKEMRSRDEKLAELEKSIPDGGDDDLEGLISASKGESVEMAAMRRYRNDQKHLAARHTEVGSMASRLAAIMYAIPLDADVSFELDAPMNVTVGQLSDSREVEGYTREGYIEWFINKAQSGLLQSKTEYRRSSMIGGEKFRPIDAYVGKTGKCFIRFIEVPGEGDIRTLERHQYIELEQELATKMFDGFRAYLENVFDDFDDKKGEDALAAVLDDLKLAANENYGSW